MAAESKEKALGILTAGSETATAALEQLDSGEACLSGFQPDSERAHSRQKVALTGIDKAMAGGRAMVIQSCSYAAPS